MNTSLTRLAVGLAMFAAAASASAVSVTVQGTSDPWLAGMPSGSPASVNDHAPGQSPAPVTGLGSLSGGYVTFTNVTGGVSFTPACCGSIEGGGFISHTPGAENGLSNVTAPVNSLVGVFLDDTQPSLSAAPGALDFTGNLNFSTLNPALRQVFFIGDGQAGSLAQQFFVPTGATRLFLGTMDGYEWSNNSGSFTLDVDYFGPSAVPEPQTYAFMLAGLAAIALGRVGRAQRPHPGPPRR
jgi:hypothetical protein